MAFFAFVLVLLTLESDTRQALIVTPLWFVILTIGYITLKKRKSYLYDNHNR
ncbi:D-alanine/D-serine/glycine permease [Yersinia enterocolitica]|nr:D-alanine/D-serine/glycine permease [Yersinia enterocolitica]